MRCPKPMIRLPLASASSTQRSGVSGGRDFLEHRLDVRRSAAVERARQRADRRRERSAAVGARRGRDPRGERGGVEPVLGRADPVGVDRLDVPRVGLAAPAQEELLRGSRSASDDVLGNDVLVLRPRRVPSARRSSSSAPRAGRDHRAPARRRSRSACRASTRRRGEPSRPGGRRGRSRSGGPARRAPGSGIFESRSSSTSRPQTFS